jgi:hypothetical protein
MDNDVRRVLEYVDTEIFTRPERWWGAGQAPKHPQQCLAQAVANAAYALFPLHWESTRDYSYWALKFHTLTGIVSWNDAAERTFEDVKARIKEALAE